MRRPPTADLPERLLAVLAGASRPLSARELGAALGVRPDAALRALRPALRDGRIVSAYGASRGGARPLVFSPGAAPAPVPAPRAPRRPAGACERRCLGCGAGFASAGPHNRMCSACRGRSSGAGAFDTPHFVRYR